MAKPLKSKNSPQIVSFVMLNVGIIYIFLTGKFDDINALFFDDWPKRATFSVIIAALAMVLNSLLDRDTKASLVFLKRANPQPGSRAFSLYGPKDPRVNMNALKKKLGNLPEDEKGQNQLWYRLLKRNETQDAIIWAHQYWLLTRDLTAITVIFAMGSIPVYFIHSTQLMVALLYYLVIFVIYLLCMGAARTNGISLVTSVLAEECAKKESKR